jgi:hypothetical protein
MALNLSRNCNLVYNSDVIFKLAVGGGMSFQIDKNNPTIIKVNEFNKNYNKLNEKSKKSEIKNISNCIFRDESMQSQENMKFVAKIVSSKIARDALCNQLGIENIPQEEVSRDSSKKRGKNTLEGYFEKPLSYYSRFESDSKMEFDIEKYFRSLTGEPEEISEKSKTTSSEDVKKNHFWKSKDNWPIFLRIANINIKQFCIKSHLQDLQLDRACTMILNSVINPERVVAYQHGVKLDSSTDKIQKFIGDIDQFYHSSRGSNTPALKYYKESGLIQALVKIIISDEDPGVRERAQYALLLLEKIDSNIASLNHEISSFLEPSSAKSEQKAFKRLENFITKLPMPLELDFSIKPHALRSNSPQYHLLLPTVESALSVSKKMEHDAFWEIQELMVGIEPGQKMFAQNLMEVAAAEGFDLTFSNIAWLRDPLHILNNKDLLVPLPLNVDQNKTKSSFLLDNKGKFPELIHHLTDDPNASVMMTGEIEQISSSPLSNMVLSPFYFEGGNLIPAINQQGDKVYLCGAYNILYSILNSMELIATEESRKDLLEEMITLENSGKFSSENVSLVKERLENAGLLANFSSEDERDMVAKITISAASYYEKLMAKTLGAPMCVVGDIFASQPAFHLDMFLLPAPGGTIFMQDYSLCGKVIDLILSHYSLDETQKETLLMYQKKSNELMESRQGALDRIAKSLEKAGFRVVSVPGVYHENESNDKINFLNAITGIGEKGAFCVTNGSSNRVDHYLRDAYVDILKYHGIANVYFLGRETKSTPWQRLPTEEFPEAEKSLAHHGGIHCRTQEFNRQSKGFKFTVGDMPQENKRQSGGYVGDTLPKFHVEMLKLIS